MSDIIQDFYNQRPYPLVDLERPTMGITPLPKATNTIHHGFGGRRPASDPLRILVAGGGSGVGLVLLGLGFRELGIATRITYLDISEHSRDIAMARAAAVGLDDIEFKTGDITSLADSEPGRYDYINFVGVINHVASSEEAVQALSHVLAEDGAIGCMAYGKLGRHGIYEFQEMVTRLLGPDPEIPVARAILAALPKNNLLRKNPLYDVLLGSNDTEFADALLNPRDRAFDTHELEQIFADAKLAHTSFYPSMLYDGAALLKAPEAVEAAKALSESDRRRVTELLHGDLNKHFLFASKSPRPNPWETLQRDPRAKLYPGNLAIPGDIDFGGKETVGISIRTDHDGRARHVGMAISELDLAILNRLRAPVTLAELSDGIGGAAFDARFERLYRLLTSLDMLHVVAI